VTDTYESYLGALSTANAGAAAAALDEALLRGESPKRLMRDVLVRGQDQVGRLWMSGAWNVADEHAATAVAEQALTVIAPPKSPPPTARRVVIACAEGEWHTMPARLAAELARSPLLDVVMLGPSVPATDLGRHLRETAPAALALSVTMPTNLIGASRSIQAARAEGVPVIVGGAAWGEGQDRARRLGADLHLIDPEQLWMVLDDAEDIDEVVGRQPPLEEHPIPAEALMLDSPATELLELVAERQAAANAWMRGVGPHERALFLQDLEWLARYTAASVACDDPTILRALLSWMRAARVPLGVPPDAVIDSCAYLADVVEPDAPAGAATLRGEAMRAHQGAHE
jgi:methanogenic corrinoid protein MtbC1